MASFFVVLVGLSFLVLIHELGHFAAAKFFGMQVEEFGIGFPPRLFSRKIGETRYSVNALPLGGFVRLHGEIKDAGADSFVRAAAWKRAIVLAAGVVMNFLAGWFIFSAVFWIGSPKVLFVDQVAPGSPAAVAGLMQGDMVLGFADAPAFIAYVAAHKGKEIVFDISRAGRDMRIAVTPRLRAVPGEGSLGVGLTDGGAPREGFFAGIMHGLYAAAYMAWSVVLGLGSLVTSPQSVAGPVGIFTIAIGAGKIGLAYVLQLLGVISLNLAVLNLLPIPALDGGRLVFMLAEKLRGRKFGAHAEERAHAFGFAFLMLVVAAVTFKDIAGLLS